MELVKWNENSAIMQTIVFHIVDFDMFKDRPLKNPVHGLGFYLFTVRSMKTTITTYKIDNFG